MTPPSFLPGQDKKQEKRKKKKKKDKDETKEAMTAEGPNNRERFRHKNARSGAARMIGSSQ